MNKEFREAYTQAALDDVEIFNLLMQTYENQGMPRYMAEHLAILRIASSLLVSSLEKVMPPRDMFAGK